MNRIIALALALTLAACGGGESASTLTIPADGKAVLLQVRSEGGFVPPDFFVNQLPRFTLLADGTLISEGPQIELYPGPMLPSIQFTTLDQASMEQVLAYVEGIGFPDIVEEINSEAADFVADAPNDVVTYFDQNGEHVFSVYALTIGQQFRDARVLQLRDLVLLLEQASLSTGPSGQYTGDQVQVYASPAQAPADPQFQNTQPWPLTLRFEELAEVGNGWRCQLFGGDEAIALMAAFAGANQLTTWDLDGTEYQLRARPLLPGEAGCR